MGLFDFMEDKEPDNEYEKEEIPVKPEGLGDIGHVVNSPHTVLGEFYSAGRLYDCFGDETQETNLQYCHKAFPVL